MRANAAITNSIFTMLSQLGPQVGVLSHFPNTLIPPFNLYIARIEPVKVIHPTKADSPAATIVTLSSSPVGKFAPSIYFHNSERATRADAAPPKPLNKATNSGIPVISTFTAIQ